MYTVYLFNNAVNKKCITRTEFKKVFYFYIYLTNYKTSRLPKCTYIKRIISVKRVILLFYNVINVHNIYNISKKTCFL